MYVGCMYDITSCGMVPPRWMRIPLFWTLGRSTYPGPASGVEVHSFSLSHRVTTDEIPKLAGLETPVLLRQILRCVITISRATRDFSGPLRGGADIWCGYIYVSRSNSDGPRKYGSRPTMSVDPE